MEKVTITFNDGTIINADLNGNCYIVDTKPEFPRDLTNITVQGEKYNQTYQNGEIIECYSIDGRYWFGINEIPADVLKERKIQADIQYIAMMADIDLEV